MSIEIGIPQRNKCGEAFPIYPGTSCLDDDFTAEELRMIDTTGGAGLSDKEMEEAWNNGERKSVITQVLKPR